MSDPQDRDVARLQLHESFSWRAALWASLIAAFVFAMLDVGLGWAVRGISPWVPLRMMAAIVLGPAALSPPDTFDVQNVVVALLLHTALSIVYGTFLALVMPRVGTALGMLLGGFYGLALYYVNLYGFNAFSPWFVDHRDWFSIASHCVFGAVLACAYVAINGSGTSRSPRRIDAVALPGNLVHGRIGLKRCITKASPTKGPHYDSLGGR